MYSTPSPANAARNPWLRPIQIVTQNGLKRQLLGLGATDHLQPQFKLALKRLTLFWNPHFAAQGGESSAEPFLGQKNLRVDHRPQWPGLHFPVRISQYHRHLALIYLAHPPIVLPRRANALSPRFLVSALIQDQQAALLQFRRLPHLFTDSLQDTSPRPRRFRHEVLHGLPIRTLHAGRYPGKVPITLHCHLPTHVCQSGVRWCPGLGL